MRTSPSRTKQRLAPAAGGGRRDLRALVVGSLVAGASTYAYQVLGVRALGEVDYAPVSVLWTVQYLVFAVLLFPLEGFVAAAPDAGRRALAWVGGVAVGAGALLLLAARQLSGGPLLLGGTGLLIVLSYGAFTVARGKLARNGDASGYALLTAGEAVVRLVLTVPVLLVGASTTAIALMLPVGPPLVLLLLLPGRQPARPPEPQPVAAGRTSGLTVATLANAGAQGPLAAGPLLVPALGGTAAEVTLAFLLLTAARLPVFLALGGLVSQQLPLVLDMRSTGDVAGLVRRTRMLLAAGAAAAAVVGVAGAVVGPAALELLFGHGLRPSAGVTACICASVVLTAAAITVDQLVAVVGMAGRLLGAWAASLVVGSAAALLWSGEALTRLAAGLLVTQLCAAALLALVVTPRAVTARLLASTSRTGG